MWNLVPPPGFQGLHPDKPIRMYVRHLPHWRQDGATYFVTYRLHDSLPQAKLRELADYRREWERQHPNPDEKCWEDLLRETMRRVDQWLDQGAGACHLKEAAHARIAGDAMHYFDGERYELGCYVVMPNHVHAIVRPLVCDEEPLERILQSWKRHIALQINRSRGTTGMLWQEESFDRIIRDEEHLWRAIQYIGANPEKARLTRGQYLLWIRPEWEKLGWRFAATHEKAITSQL